jgi:hypothetical protein
MLAVAPRTVRFLPLRAGWPLTGLLLGYPLWWALGLGVLIFPLAAVPMVVLLVRRRRLVLPPGFALWLIFLVVVVVSVGALGDDPPGTVPSSVPGRLLPVAFRLVEYLALTVLVLYAGNLTEEEMPRQRLAWMLGWLFAVTVGGGLLGVFAGRFQFSSPIELLLPHRLRTNGFVQSLVHPAAAQVMSVLGHPSPRPAAPWGYTNTWGNNFCLLVVWFVVAAFGYRTSVAARIGAVALLAVACVPAVLSLNRGLWLGLALICCYVAVRLALRGRFAAIVGIGVAATALAATVAATPLGTVVGERLDHGKSNGVRTYLTVRALNGLVQSPVIGFGSTRNTSGGRKSITVGESATCQRCGNFTIGGNGQLWQLLYVHGLTGALCYIGFFGFGLWRFRRDRSAVGIAGGAAIVASMLAGFWYNSLVTPLAFTMLGYALLWRNATQVAVFPPGTRRLTATPAAPLAAAFPPRTRRLTATPPAPLAAA